MAGRPIPDVADGVRETGIYHNRRTMQYEAWAVNQATGETFLISTLVDGLGGDAYHYWARETWRRFLAERST